MKSWNAQRALLSKDLQHNRGYFLVTLVLLIYVPVFKSLFYLGQGGSRALDWGQQLSYILNFNQLVMGPPPLANNTMHMLGVMASILLGSIILGEERKGSLTYLVTTPVARRDIMLSKFMVGATTLLLAMGIIVIFLISLSGPLGLDLGSMVLLRWAVVTCLGWICLFTLALLASTFTAAVIPAAVVSFLLVYLPGALVAMVESIAARYFHAPEAFSIKAQYWGNYLTITDYLTGEHWMIIHHVQHYPDWRIQGVSGGSGPAPQLGLESMLLLLGIVVLLGLAVLVFERLSLDEQGAFLASPRTRQGFIVLSGWLAGHLLIFPLCSTLSIYLAGQAGMIMAFYGLFEWLPQRLGGAVSTRKIVASGTAGRNQKSSL